MKNNKKTTKSIQSKALIAFMLLSLSIIAVMWLFQALFYSTIYKKIKSTEISTIASTIVVNYKFTENYTKNLEDIAFQRDVNILIFEMIEDRPNVIFIASRQYSENDIDDVVNTMLGQLGNDFSTKYLLADTNDYQTICYGRKDVTDDVSTYFLVSSQLAPTSLVKDSFQKLLIILSIGEIIISILGSYTLSHTIAKPIINIANKAKELASNSNADIVFDSNEYIEVEQLSKTLNYSMSEIKKSDAIRKEVLANVSHELKTPLTMIKSYTELIKDISGDNKEDREKHLQVIYDEANRLEYLLNDMLLYSKLESGAMQYEMSVFNIADRLRNFYNLYRDKYTDFSFSIECPDKVFVYADEKRIDQVVVNLLNNAINYSKNNKVINIKLTKVKNSNKYRLDIIDHGMGISKENLPYIFDRHFRTNSAKRATVGSGIGLSIVKHILTYHEFDFGVESEEKKGSDFYIIFNSIKKGDKNETKI